MYLSNFMTPQVKNKPCLELQSLRLFLCLLSDTSILCSCDNYCTCEDNILLFFLRQGLDTYRTLPVSVVASCVIYSKEY